MRSYGRGDLGRGNSGYKDFVIINLWYMVKKILSKKFDLVVFVDIVFD